ncbi:MAG: hypothetical protein AB1898_29485 [Acidobacteriota bacterium]
MRCLLGLLLSFPLWVGNVLVLNAQAQPQVIKKIYFLIHPLTWVNHSTGKFKTYFEYEKDIEVRWYQAISAIGPDEALVLWPMTKSKRADDLVRYAQTTLGVRCVTIPRSKDWYGCCEEGGKRGIPAKLDRETLAGIGQDLVEAMLARGEKWPVDEMSQAMTARTWVKDIQSAFRERGLRIDAATVQSEAWGESFDGCMGKWSSFLAHYLGLQSPVAMRFELSVPDAPFLLEATFLESIPLHRNVRLFLWKARDDRLVGFYQVGLQSVADRNLYAELESTELPGLEVQDKSGNKIWPGENSVLVERNEKVLRVAVSRNLARRPGWNYAPGEPVYVFGKGFTLEAFRTFLMQAPIVEDSSAPE